MPKRLALLALLTGCASAAHTAPVTGLPDGEAGRLVTGTVAAPSPVSTPTRATERRKKEASRSRVQILPTTGTLTDTTCYAATGSRTASGKWPRVGMAASNRYPFGTRLRVEHVGVVTVEDRIGHGTALDLFGPSENYCRHFGRQRLLVEVVK